MATVTLNHAGLERLLVSPTGPVMLDMLRRGRNVLEVAKQTCPVHLGNLAASLKISMFSLPTPWVEVGSDHRELIYVEEGTGPAHEPDPHAAYFPNWRDPRFALWATDHGGSAFGLAIHISLYGTQPFPFMKNALRAAAQ